MNAFKKTGLVSMLLAGIGVTACAAEPTNEQEENAPEAVLDAADSQDEGTEYNGWSQSMFFTVQICVSGGGAAHTLTRSYGDATRGGGACYVERTTTSCSSDSTCLGVATAQYGGSAYGYCYQGTCYSRPGSQASWCANNPNRAPGHVYPPYQTNFSGTGALLGCMTKTAGPNTACGGTNTSLYMRSVAPQYLDFYGCW
jgi:hypothetical protein